MSDVCLFHWSPSTRHRSILRRGLEPGKLSTDRLWRPPYVAYAPHPSLAWALSGRFRPEVESWDLWQTWTSRIEGGYETLFDDRDNTIKEFRVYERIPKRDIWYVGTRPGVTRVTDIAVCLPDAEFAPAKPYVKP